MLADSALFELYLTRYTLYEVWETTVPKGRGKGAKPELLAYVWGSATDKPERRARKYGKVRLQEAAAAPFKYQGNVYRTDDLKGLQALARELRGPAVVKALAAKMSATDPDAASDAIAHADLCLHTLTDVGRGMLVLWLYLRMLPKTKKLVILKKDIDESK